MGKETEAGSGVGEPKFLYGWFSFTPRCLQKINKAGFFLLFMCIGNVFQSMAINGLVGVVLSSLETRFGLASSQSSWIASAYDVSTVPMLALVSYLGSRSHRPRWTAMGLGLLVVGTFVFIIPHFATPPYRPLEERATSEIDEGLCLTNLTNGTRPGAETGGGSTSLQGYLAVFILGRVLHGIGAVPMYTIAVTYMDDGVSKESFSLYISLFYAAGVLGPAFGYIVGGYLLTIFTDFYQVPEPGIDSNHPRWVGAWWVGFLVGAIGLFLVMLPLSGYARDFPGAAAIRAKKESEAYNAGDQEDPDSADGDINVSLKELPRYLLDLLTNPTYVFLTLMVCCDSLLMGGFTAFGPKYVQEQFAVSAALSGMMFGIVVIPGGAGGTIAGGLIVKKLALKCAGIMKAEMVFSTVILVGGFMFFIVCDPLKFAGLTVGYNDTAKPDQVNFTASCNVDCGCNGVAFKPVCSVDNIQYYSPCHAGCTSNAGDSKAFYNCTCVNQRLNISEYNKPPATTDPCTVPECKLMPLFMFIFFCAMFCLFACSGMNISATVRCLPSSHRSLGIGVQWIFLRLLGTVPGPPLFGAAFDRACEQFAIRDDGSKGQCLFYDKRALSLLLFTICVVVKLASLLFIVLAWKLYKPPPSVEKTVEVDIKPSVNGTANGGFTRAELNAISAHQTNGQVNQGFETEHTTLPRKMGESAVSTSL